MFLDVSAKLDHMPATPSEEERRAIGGRVRMRRQEVFGTKSEAYKAAGLNAATWDRIEKGEVVREDRLIAAVRTLWPNSGGDWTGINIDRGDGVTPVFSGSYEDPGYLENIEKWIFEIVTRVEALEGYVARQREEGGGTHEDLVDPAEKSGDGVVTPIRPEGMRRKAAREADVPDKED